ncbi:glycosyltransferase [Parvularcula oceani]|uniref:glycosyltransferase n=1 Tax=Parvularcula oceani TaxID=1247963 RepID=UPI00055C8E2B|nr:glycosyltransferase [Parvularcula oceani]
MTETKHGLQNLFGMPEEEKTPQRETEAPSDSGTAGAEPSVPTIEGVSNPVLTPQPEPSEPFPVTPAAPQEAPARPSPAPAARTGTATLSCVVLALSGWAAARRTLEALRAQTQAGRIELIAVGINALTDAEAGEEFAAVRTLVLDRGVSWADAAAAGLLAANGQLVALLDDYAFPARDWAEHVLTHQNDRFAALGSSLSNANPRSRYSWANMLLENGRWREGMHGGEVDALPARNLVFRRDALAPLSDELPRLLRKEGALVRHLRESGQPLKMEDEALIGILNPSTFNATLKARFAEGRLAAASEGHRMSGAKRIAKALPALFSPYPRYRREKTRLFLGGDVSVNPKTHGRAVLLGMMSEGAGRAAGYLRGPGKAERVKDALTRNRAQHLSKTDRRQFAARRD